MRRGGVAVAAVMREDNDVEGRVARLESDVAHIQADVAEMKVDIRGLRQDVAVLRDEMHKGHSSLERKIIRASLNDRIWMLTLIGAVLAVMAHGFKWF